MSSSSDNGDRGVLRQPRGPFLPRSDPANRRRSSAALPGEKRNDEDDDEVVSRKKKRASSSSSSSKIAVGWVSRDGDVGIGRPPQHGGSKQRRPPIEPSSLGHRRQSASHNNNERLSSLSTPVARQRRHSWSLPISPANSRGSASSVRSYSSLSCKLRHGDGSLPGSIGIVGGVDGKKKAAAAGEKAATGGDGVQARFRSERAKPARATKAPAKHRASVSGPTVNSKPQREVGEGRTVRTRTPSPVAALKRLGRRRSKSSTSTTTDDDDEAKDRPPSEDSIDEAADEPTPVKEARRLSSLFRGREDDAAARRAPGAATPVDERDGDDDASSPLSKTKLFRAAGTVVESARGRDVDAPADPNGAPAAAALSAYLFSSDARHDDDDASLRRLLRRRPNDSKKRWDLRGRLEEREADLTALRAACRDLLARKDEFVEGAVGIERGLRSELEEKRRVEEGREEERRTLQASLEGERDESERQRDRLAELTRERDREGNRAATATSERDHAREEAEELRRRSAEDADALASAESKLADASSREEEALAELARAESSHAKHFEEARAGFEEALSSARAENDALRREAEARRRREEDVCRWFDLDIALAEVAASGEGDTFSDRVERRLEDLRKDVEAKDRAEKGLEKAKADHRAALEAAAAKDRDVSRLAESIGDVQRSGQERREEIDARRRAAEDRADAAEDRLVECRENLEKARSDCRAALETAASKDRDMSELAKSIGDLQRSSRDREKEMDARRASAEDRAAATEGRLARCREELENVKCDHQAALETAASKDHDISELAKSIGDIQRTANDRQTEISTLRESAERHAAAFEGQIAKCREELHRSEREKTFLEEALEASEAECAAHANAAATLRKEIDDARAETARRDAARTKEREREEEERAERVTLAAQLDARMREGALVERRLRDSLEEAERSATERIRLAEEASKGKDAEIDRMSEAIASLEAHQLSLKRSLTEQKSMLDASKEEEIGRLNGDIANLELKLETASEKMRKAGVASEANVRELEEAVRKGRAERKRMHNIIQELRGNVRVFARIRPFLPNDGKHGKENDTKKPFVTHDGDDMVTVTKPKDSRQKSTFSFDRVFAPSAGQDSVYEEVSEFVQSALDGYNVTLFSYGQTGSGKTHTMQGTGAGVMRGLIPRSIEQICAHKVHLKNDGWTFSMELSFLEIYNESLRDLLRESSKEKNRHDIKVGEDGRRTITNLTVKSIDPDDQDAIHAVLSLAAKRRSTAYTDMNATSSRSHSVFTLNLTAKHEGRNQLMRGTLNLVDLAGSERLNRSNAEGRRAEETVSINKSLSSLTDVFTAIGQKQSHVPFRNSKLTYLLQPSLSGDGKTLMIVNISPTEASMQESLCSLRFASKVNRCELGKAKRTIEEVKTKGGTASNKRGDAAAARDKSVTCALSRNVKRKM